MQQNISDAGKCGGHHLLKRMASAPKVCGSVGTPSRMSLPLVFSSGSRAEISCGAETVSRMPSREFMAACIDASIDKFIQLELPIQK